MLHINSINLDMIKEEGRLNPRYFRFLIKRNKLIESSSMNFYSLGHEFVTKITTDGEHQAINLYEEDEAKAEVRYLYVQNIKEGIIDLTDSLYISRKDHERLKRSQLNKGNVLLTIVGTIGKSAMVYDYVDEANIPRNISKIVVNEKNILPEFLVVVFLSKLGREQSYYSSGGNIQGLLSLTKLRSMVVPVPDINIQRKIGNIYLDALDKETEALKLINKARNYFYKKLGIDFTKLKKQKFFQTDLNDLKKSNLWTPIYRFPLFLDIVKALKSKWKVEKLGELFDVSKGDEVGSINYHDFIYRKENYVPFVRTSDIANYEVDRDPDYFIPNEIYDELKQDIQERDILFTKDGKIGMCAIVTKSDEIIISSGIVRLRLKESVKEKYKFLTPEYLFIVLSTKETGLFPALRRTVIAATIPHLREERLKEIEIPLLDKNSINHITDLVKEAFVLKDQKKKLLKKLKSEINQLLGYK